MSANEQFNVEAQFIKYLNHRGYKLDKMHPLQLQEIRRSFYGGFGQLIILMQEELDGLMVSTDQYKTMVGLSEQIVTFWETEAQNHNDHEN